MVFSLIDMLQGTIALLFAALLGVSGLTREVYVLEDAVAIQVRPEFGLALGSFVFHNDPQRFDHEVGHIRQQRLLGPVYVPLMVTAYAVMILTGTYGWPETWADELGDL